METTHSLSLSSHPTMLHINTIQNSKKRSTREILSTAEVNNMNKWSSQQNVINLQQSAENYFLNEHIFSDLTITVNGGRVFVDKSLLAAASPILQNHFQENPSVTNIDLIDIHLDQMLVLLKFLYPQFDCTLTRENVSFLVEMSERFKLNILHIMCRNFIIYYLSKVRGVNDDKYLNKKNYRQGELQDTKEDLILFEDGTQVNAQRETGLFLSWLCVYFDSDNMRIIEPLMNVIKQCSIECLKTTIDLNGSVSWKMQAAIYKARAQYLERTFI